MPPQEESIEAARSLIREAGLRSTPSRIAILAFFMKGTSPQPHSVVAEALSPIGVDKATVFRNLKSLSEAGLLRRTELGDHVWRFELVRQSSGADGHHDESHPHFLCVECGKITCLEDVKLTQESQNLTTSVGQITEILVRGHCNDCRDES